MITAKPLIYLVITLCICHFGAHAEEPFYKEFDQLKKWHNDSGLYIQIRGFLYVDEQSRWILAKEPNLRTCCIGSEQKKDQQLVLDGSFSNEDRNRAITVEGNLYVSPIDNKMELRLAKKVIKQNSLCSLQLIYSILLSCLVFVLYKTYKLLLE